MNQGQTIFSQLLSFLSKYEFDKCVKRYNGNYRVRSFRCWEQFLVMCFAQLTYRESLRDIEACLGSMSKKLYHSGIKSPVSRSTLAEANEQRDWRIYADFAHELIAEARTLYSDDNDFGLELNNMAYAFDSTTIDLCLSLFPWAKFQKHKAAVKVHTQLDLRGNIPMFIHITSGSVHDINVMDEIMYEAGAIYVFDRGYIDFERLYKIEESKAYFVIRAKENLVFQRIYSKPVDRTTGIRCDQIIKLKIVNSLAGYPEKIRRVKYYDKEKNKRYVYLTNNMELPPMTIANLYKERWKIELFFKWIKQHLRIKVFYGTSSNAVNTQIWIAVSIYLIVAIMKQKLQLKQSLYTILQILSISLFEKMPIRQAFQQIDYKTNLNNLANQLILFE
jgi:transposase